LALAAAGCLATPAAAQVLDCDVAGQSVSPSNGATTAGKTGLMRCVDRATGELRREQELRDGRFVGLNRWHEGGRLRREYSTNDKGNRDGRFREWNARGVLVKEGVESNASSVGLHREWRDDGTLRSVAHWGEPGGERRNEAQSRMAFNARGQPTELRCALRPLLDDEERLCGHGGAAATTDLFTESGALAARVTHERGRLLRQELLWDDGKPRSIDDSQGPRRVVQQFSREGVKRRETVRLDGQRVLEQEFSERGTLVVEKRWTAAGWQERESEWYLNGQPRRVRVYEAADGATRPTSFGEQTFHDDGRRTFEGRWRLDDRGSALPTGAHVTFDEAGRPRFETVHDERGRPARERAWDESGALQRDDEVFEDGSRKALRR
jgi:hypothetical protein